MLSGVPQNSGARRAKKPLLAEAAQRARNSVAGPGAARLHHRPGAGGMGLDRDVAILADREIGTEPHGDPREATQIRRHAIFLHARVNDRIRPAQGDEVRRMQRRDRDAAAAREDFEKLHGVFRAAADNPVDLRRIVEERVMKRHATSEHRRMRIIAERGVVAFP